MRNSRCKGQTERLKVPFSVDRANPESLTRQIESGFRQAVASGFYRIGDSLPSREQIAADLQVSEYVVRAALSILSSEGLVVNRRGSGCRVVGKRTGSKFVLDVNAENFGAFSSNISMVEFARAIALAGHRVETVVLGADRKVPYLKPLSDALSRIPDFVIVRTSTTVQKVVAKKIADRGCPYAVMALRDPGKMPGRFIGNMEICSPRAMVDLADDCRKAGVRSVLQVDFGRDAYVSAERDLYAVGISVERLSVNLAGPMDLDRLVDESRATFERRISSRCLPDLVFVADDYLALGVLEALRRKGVSVPKDVKLVVYANRGSGFFPFGDLARIEFDPRRDGRTSGERVVSWFETGILPANSCPPVYIRGRSFPVP